MASTDPFPVLTDDLTPLGGEWWISGSDMIVEYDGRQSTARYGPFVNGRLWVLARRLRAEIEKAPGGEAEGLR